jgi:hypothetical protein
MLRKSMTDSAMVAFSIESRGNAMKLTSSLVVALIAGAGLTAPAFAASEDFCRDYARAALRQVQEAHEMHHCVRGLDNATRWSEDFRVHFDWCRSVSREDAQRERDIRRCHLEECRDR